MELYSRLKECKNCKDCLKWNPYFTNDKLLNKFLKKCQKTCSNSFMKSSVKPHDYINALKLINKNHVFDDDSRDVIPSSQPPLETSEASIKPSSETSEVSKKPSYENDVKQNKCINGGTGDCSHNICKFFYGKSGNFMASSGIRVDPSKPLKKGKTFAQKSTKRQLKSRRRNPHPLKNITNIKSKNGFNKSSNSTFSFVDGKKVYRIFDMKKTPSKSSRKESGSSVLAQNVNIKKEVIFSNEQSKDDEIDVASSQKKQKVDDTEELSASSLISDSMIGLDDSDTNQNNDLDLDVEIQRNQSCNEKLTSSFIDESMKYSLPFESNFSPIKGVSSLQEDVNHDEIEAKKNSKQIKSLNSNSKKHKLSSKQLNFEKIDSNKKINLSSNSMNRTLDEFFSVQTPIKKNISNSRIKTSDKLNKPKKTCPFYKKIEGSKIVMDAFKYGEIPGVLFYFLSHFHYDHFIGLSKQWKKKIYCSNITANLVKLKYRYLSKYVVPLPMNEQIAIGDFFVTLLPANHCPGAAIFCFKLPNNKCILHTGDFRADLNLVNNLQDIGCKFSTVYLDTTFLNPKYNFPAQNEVVDFTTSKVMDCLQLYPKTLVLYGTYTIGKEKIFLDLAKKLNKKVYVTTEKLKLLKCLEDKEVEKYLTTDKDATNIQVVPMNQLKKNLLYKTLNNCSATYTKILAIKPTGWAFKNGLQNDISFDSKVILMELPYSEHSSFDELENFVKTIKPEKIIPTVNVGSPTTRVMMKGYLDKWRCANFF